MQEGGKKGENGGRKKRGRYCGHGRAAEETQAPPEGDKGNGELVFGFDKGGVEEAGRVTTDSRVGSAGSHEK